MSSPNSPRLLLVDDHSVVRDVTATMLRSLGYEVITAADGYEALEYYKSHSSEVDLVILDLVMPRMDARQCFEQLRKLNPSVKAILMTGCINTGIIKELINEGLVGYMQKPFGISYLSTAVINALNTVQVTEALAHEVNKPTETKKHIH